MKLEDLKKLKDEYISKVEEHGKEALREELDAFFKARPEVTVLSWAQYVPAFNDGDPCEFTLTDVRVKLEKESLKDHLDPHEANVILEDKWEEYENRSQWGSDLSHDSWDLKDSSSLSKALTGLSNKLFGLADLLEITFGTYTRVIATRDEITTEDFDGYY